MLNRCVASRPTGRGGRHEAHRRLLAIERQLYASDLASGCECSDFATDSYGQFIWQLWGLFMKRPYVTAARLDAIRSSLSERDWQIIDDINRLRLLSGQQLQRLHCGTTASDAAVCRRQLGRLVSKRVLVRFRHHTAGMVGPSWSVYALDVAGQRLVDPDRTRWWPTPNPGNQFIDHTLATAEVYVRLRGHERHGGFELVTFDGEPACWRGFHGPGGARLTVKPDAFVITEAHSYEDHVFVEVDLGTETSARIVTKAMVYLSYYRSGREQHRSGVFPLVLWLVPDAARLDLLTTALGRLPADSWQLFQIRLLDDAVDAITTGGVVSIGGEQ